MSCHTKNEVEIHSWVIEDFYHRVDTIHSLVNEKEYYLAGVQVGMLLSILAALAKSLKEQEKNKKEIPNENTCKEVENWYYSMISRLTEDLNDIRIKNTKLKQELNDYIEFKYLVLRILKENNFNSPTAYSKILEFLVKDKQKMTNQEWRDFFYPVNGSPQGRCFL